MEQARQYDNTNLLFDSARKGDLETIKSLVELEGVDSNYVEVDGFTALHCAVISGHSAIVEYLVRNGADVNLKNQKGYSPLLLAVKFGSIEAAEILTQHGAHIGTRDRKGRNLLDVAMKIPRERSMRFVLKLGLCIYAHQYGKLLMVSAQNGDLETIRSLVELKDADINYLDNNGERALHCAAEGGYSAIVNYLVLNGAILDSLDGYGKTPLFKAIEMGQVEAAKALILHGARFDTVNAEGENLLHAAMHSLELESMRFVLGVDLQISADQCGKLLSESFRKSDFETIKSLIEPERVDINHVDHAGKSALHCAASVFTRHHAGHSAIIEYLVDKGASVDAETLKGETPLFEAVKWSRVETAKTLIRLGAKINTVNKNRENLLDAAITRDGVESLRFVLELGFSIDQYDGAGFTPLMRACRSRKKSCAAFLLENGANYRKYSIPDGLSPLHLIMSKWSGVEWLVKLLLEHVEISEGEEGMLKYVDYNGTTDGQTALHIACIVGDRGAAKLLLHCGANPDIKDKSGKVAYDYVSSDDNGYYTRSIRSVFDEM